MIDKTPSVFISYSWTSKEYQEKVKELAERLIRDGVDVKLDIWDLRDGQDKYVYMEQCVNNPNIDRVLILCDKAYARKADKRQGGVGDETTIISPELYNNATEQKFIPIVMEKDENGEVWLPAYLKTRIYKDFSGDNFEAEYESLVRNIYDEPLSRKPELGSRPLWLNYEPAEIQSLKMALKNGKSEPIPRLKEIETREFIDTYIDSIKHFYKSSYDGPEEYLDDLNELKEYRNVFLDYLKVISSNNHFGLFMADAFEKLYNSLYNIYTYKPEATGFVEDSFDIYKIHIWELFICTTAYLIHNEMYSDIFALLHHTYFLRDYPSSDTISPRSYAYFRCYSRLMDERFKSKLPDPINRKYTVSGHYLVTEREYLPLYSKKSMANADLFLYQVYNGIGLEGLTRIFPWFPSLYVYANQHDSMWKRLTSKEYCKKIMPIFGVNTIDELKEKIANCQPDSKIRYSSGFVEPAPNILSFVKLEEIAVLP